MTRKFVLTVWVTAISWAVMAAAALAQGDGERVGENVGELLGGWARSLYVGIAAVVALMFLLEPPLRGSGGVHGRRGAGRRVRDGAQRCRGHGARHLADDHGLMSERVVIRSYRRVFEVDRRIYRVDRWALPVPGGVPLRAVAYFAATVLALVVLGRLPGTRELVGLLSPPLRYVVVPLAVAVLGIQAAPDGRSAHRFAADWLRLRVRARRRCAGRVVELEGEPVRWDGAAGRALGRRRHAAASRPRARAGAGDVQRAGRAATVSRPGRARRWPGRATLWCCARARCWRCGHDAFPAALRAPEHPRRRRRRARRAVPRRHGLLPVPGGRRQARVAAAAGALRVRGRGRLLALPRLPRLPRRELRAAGDGAARRAPAVAGGVALVPARARDAPARAALLHARGLPGRLAAEPALVRAGSGATAHRGPVRGGDPVPIPRRGDRRPGGRRATRVPARRARAARPARDDARAAMAAASRGLPRRRRAGAG